jgi:hypothetical protein
MNRRRFIILSVIGVLSAIALSIVAIYDFETVVLKILKRDLSYLKIKESDMLRFLDDARNSGYWERVKFDKKKKAFVVVYFLLPRIGLPYEFKFVQLRAQIVGNFLLSTDFFTNKMDEQRDIQYVALFDPELRACQNPFSHMYYPQNPLA